MELGICQVSIAPIRSTPSDKSEMVTQLLFGETVTVLEKRENWRKIKCSWDNYVGWTDHKLLRSITAEQFEAYKETPAYCLDLVHPVMGDGHFVPVVLGSSLPLFDGMQLQAGEVSYSFNGQVITPSSKQITFHLLQRIIARYLNAPYLWGGRSPFGIDCSGFTQNVFKLLGYPLLRDASQQVKQGDLVGFFNESKIGDLAFFENSKKRIAHVGIIVEDNRIVHAHGKVRVDKLDAQGIFNEETQTYTHQLRVIKRILPEDTEKGGEVPVLKQAIASPQLQMGLF